MKELDEIINGLVDEYSFEFRNISSGKDARQWRLLIRTVRTTLDIIQTIIDDERR